MSEHSDPSSSQSSESPQAMARSERFIQLLTTHRNNIYAYILTLVHNISDADDLMQETTSVMWRKYIETTDDIQNFVAWGIRIAHNKVLDFRKRKTRERVMFNQEICDELADSYRNDDEDMDSMLRALDQCISKLNRRNRQLVEMVHKKGVTIKRVSQQIGLSVHTAYKLIPRIHHQLLRCIMRTLGMEEIA